MRQHSKGRDELWSYVHGELNADDAERLKDDCAADAGLAAEIENVRRDDEVLRRVLPLTAWTDEDVEERIIRAMEADGVAVLPAAEPRRGLQFPSWRASAGVLAAAAALLVVLSVPLAGRRDPLRCGKVSFVAVEYRGGEPSPTSRYAPEAVETSLAHFRDAVRIAGRAHAAALGKTRPVLELSVREMPTGVVLVGVTAIDAHGNALGEWTEQCDSLAAFDASAGGLALRIAEELAAREAGGEAIRR